MDQYFERTQQLLCRGDFPVRIRFMIEDVIELRNTKVKTTLYSSLPLWLNLIREQLHDVLPGV